MSPSLVSSLHEGKPNILMKLLEKKPSAMDIRCCANYIYTATLNIFTCILYFQSELSQNMFKMDKMMEFVFKKDRKGKRMYLTLNPMDVKSIIHY